MKYVLTGSEEPIFLHLKRRVLVTINILNMEKEEKILGSYKSIQIHIRRLRYAIQCMTHLNRVEIFYIYTYKYLKYFVYIYI